MSENQGFDKLSPKELIRRIHFLDKQLGHGRRLSLLEVERLVSENPYLDPGGDAFDSLPKHQRRPFINFLLSDGIKTIFKLGYSMGRLDGVKSALEMSDQDVEEAIKIAADMRVHAHLIEDWDKKEIEEALRDIPDSPPDATPTP